MHAANRPSITAVRSFVDFKKEHGFYGIPMASGEPSSPYQIPVVGEDREDHGRGAGGYRIPGPHYDGDYGLQDDGKYETELEDMDDEDGSTSVSKSDLSAFDDGIGPGYSDRFGDVLSSPYKYHYDVSAADDLKGGSLGFDDQV